jgi:hypothetical protein
MGLDNPKSGVNPAVEYTVPGIPWVTSSVLLQSSSVSYEFANVAKAIVIQNQGPGTINVGFSYAGVASSSNYFSITSGSNQRLDLRLRNIFLATPGGQAGFSIIASLSGIRSADTPVLTGSSQGIFGIG